MFTNLKKKLRRLLAMVISTLLVISVVVPVEARAAEPVVSPYDRVALESYLQDAYSYGYGGLLDLRLINDWYLTQNGETISVADLRGVDQKWVNSENDLQGPVSTPLDLSLLQDVIYLNLGELLQIPLLGEDALLEFVLAGAETGLLREQAHAPSATTAEGGVGVVSDSGGIELTQPGSGANANIDLLKLLQIGGADLETYLGGAITAAELEVGALSAVANKPEPNSEGGARACGELTRFDYDRLKTDSAQNLFGDETVLDEERDRFCSEYQIAGAEVVVKSPLLGSLVSGVSDTLSGLLGGVTHTLNGLLGEEGALDSVLSLVPLLNLIVEVDVKTDDITATLLEAPLISDNGLVTIQLANEVLPDGTYAPATISIDLEKLHANNLNGQPANTSLLSGEQLGDITTTVTDLLTAPKSQEPHGLIARLDNILRGENKQGGLYATEVELKFEVWNVLAWDYEPLVNLSATLGGLLGGPLTRTTDEEVYKNNPYTHYYTDGALGTILGPVVASVLNGVGTIVENLLFGDDGLGSLLNGIVNSLFSSSGLVPQLVDVLNPVLSPIANIIMNRQTLQQVDNGTVFTVSALEINVLDLTTDGELLHLPLATASVMAQHWNLIELNLDVAKIGDGRGLHTGGYTYELRCEAENGWTLTEEGLTYNELNIGSGFSFADNQLHLTGATGGLAEPLRVKPGAECTVTANPALADHDALRPTPTGDDSTVARTPYTYFLDTDGANVLVSGDTPADQPTSISSTGVTLDENQVKVDATEVGAEWKTHSFTFLVPEDVDSHRVSIVHAYDLDRRDIEITKAVAGASVEDKFAFQYSLDDGETWLNGDTTIGHGETLTIKDVPVLNESLTDTTVMIRENLGTNPAGPLVSWKLNNADLTNTYGDGYATTASFVSGPVATVPTPKQQIDITNSYAAISVDKHIDGLLDGIGSTTLVPADNTEMTIRYTVENTGAVDLDLDTITIYDSSLKNAQFTLPEGIRADATTGAVSGCVLTFNEEGIATCEFTVTLKEDFSHYEADEAEATIVATATIDGREVTATATDKHGAMRLPDLTAMLPNTGATTLVWVLGLGVLVALVALINYIRSRRN